LWHLTLHIKTVVGIFLLVNVFLGGNFTELAIPTALVFGVKVLFVLLAFSVAGVLYARLRIDQLASLGWKVLAPLALAQMLIVIWIGVE